MNNGYPDTGPTFQKPSFLTETLSRLDTYTRNLGAMAVTDGVMLCMSAEQGHSPDVARTAIWLSGLYAAVMTAACVIETATARSASSHQNHDKDINHT